MSLRADVLSPRLFQTASVHHPSSCMQQLTRFVHNNKFYTGPYQHISFLGSLILQCRRRKQYVPLKFQYPSTILHGV